MERREEALAADTRDFTYLTYASRFLVEQRAATTLLHHGGPSVSRMTLSVPLICGYGSGSAGRSWTCRAVRRLGTGSSHLSLGYRLPSGGVLWQTVLDGDALPLAQMTQITLLQRTRFWLVLFSSAHVVPAAFISASVLLRQVCFGRPTFRFPCGFQSRACLVMLDAGFGSVWPIQPHLRFLISVSIGVCFVLSHSCLFETTSGHLMLRMFLRHLLVKLTHCSTPNYGDTLTTHPLRAIQFDTRMELWI